MKQAELMHNNPYQGWELDDFIQKAIAFRSQGRSKDAVDLCVKGLDQYPLSIDLKCQLGLACFEKGDEEGAKRELEEVARVMERNRAAFKVLEKIREQERKKSALRDPSRKRELPNLSLIPIEKKTRTLADLYIEQGYIQEAFEIYKEILRENPDDQHLKKMVQELIAKLEKTETKKGQKGTMESEEVNKREVLDILYSWRMAIKKRRKEKEFMGVAKKGFRIR